MSEAELAHARWKRHFVATLVTRRVMARPQAAELANYLWAQRPNLRAIDAADVAQIFASRQSALNRAGAAH